MRDPRDAAAAVRVAEPTPEHLARKFHDSLFDGAPPEEATAIFVDHAVGRPAVAEGMEAMHDLLAAYRAAFPDLHLRVEAVTAEDDRVVTRWAGQGTHRGEMFGIAPTGRAATVEGVSVGRLERGRIVESWIHFDTQGLLAQLRTGGGAARPPKSPAAGERSL